MPLQLGNLPDPDIVDKSTFETIYREMRDRFLTYLPNFADVEDTDPAFVVMQQWAYRELLLRQRQNDAARANFASTATGADLDNLAVNLGVTRRVLVPADPDADPPIAEVLETDTSLRKRFVNKLETIVAGSPSWYQALAFELSGDPVKIKDAYAWSPSGGNVNIAIIVADTITDATERAAVKGTIQAALRLGDDNQFVGVEPVVSDAVGVAYGVTAQIRPNDSFTFAGIQASVKADLTTFLEAQEKIGRVLYVGEIYETIISHQGVSTAVITSPANKIDVASNQYAAFNGTITLTELT